MVCLLPQFHDIVASALRLRNTVLLELLLLVLAFTGYWVTLSLAPGVSAWYGAWVDGHLQLGPAEYWTAL